jgi:NADH-quinone oxidoreductase subunit E
MLSAESKAKIDKELTKYPADRKQSAIMSSLRIAQEEHGWLSNELIEYVASYLEIPAIAAYEVATFYNMYNLQPVGKYKITVCSNLSCTLCGAREIIEHLEQKLDITVGETTPDGRFTLQEGECMGACGDAPLFLVNNRNMASFLNPEKVDQILAELK